MLNASISPFHLLYVSAAAPGVNAEDVNQIATVSRKRNLQRGISGALLFDGNRFSQLLEGSVSEVRPLYELIRVDPRHQQVTTNAAGYFGLPRLMTRWRLCYCTPDDLDQLNAEPVPTNELALALFMSALSSSKVV